MNCIMDLCAKGQIADKSIGSKIAFEIGDDLTIDANAQNAIKFLNDETLVRCDVFNYNGRQHLNYNVENLMTLTSVLNKASSDEFVIVINHLLHALLNIREHGLLNMACVLLDFDRMYIKGTDLRVCLIYVPVVIARSEQIEKQLTRELCDNVLAIIERINSVGEKKLTGSTMAKMEITMHGAEVTLEELIAIIEQGSGQPAEERFVERQPERTVPEQHTQTHFSGPLTQNTGAVSERLPAAGPAPRTVNNYQSGSQRLSANLNEQHIMSSRPAPSTPVGMDSETDVLGEIHSGANMANAVFELQGYRQSPTGECISEYVSVPIAYGETVLGRGSDADIQISVSGGVGRIHCKVICEKGKKPSADKLFIMDIGITKEGKKGSRNGTFVKNKKKPLAYGKKVKIAEGEKIWLADVMFEVKRVGM